MHHSHLYCPRHTLRINRASANAITASETEQANDTSNIHTHQKEVEDMHEIYANAVNNNQAHRMVQGT